MPKEELGSYTFTEILSGLNLSERLKIQARQNLKTILSKRGIFQERTSKKRCYKLPPIMLLNNLKELSTVIDNSDNVHPNDS